MYNRYMNTINEHDRDLERIRKLRLIDDDFMSVCFDNYIEGTELLLRVILGRDDIVVTEVHSQKQMKSLTGRDIWLDILAVDNKQNQYNIEIQRANEGADPKRARYHSSMMDSHMLSSGCRISELHDSFVIFITEGDVLGRKIPLYKIERKIDQTNEPFNDGGYIIYVNGECKDLTTDLGNLMHDFFCTDPTDMIHKELSDRVKYYKESEKGVDDMCQILEEMRNEVAKNVTREVTREVTKNVTEKHALAMILDGVDLEKIAQYTGLPLSRVRELAGEKTA